MTGEKPAVQNKRRERELSGVRQRKEFDREAWMPRTSIGKKVKNGEIATMDGLLDYGQPILEAGIVDCLVPNLEHDLLSVGQSKGKFGGGKASIWRQTQKKTPEGNKPSFAAVCVAGNRDGLVGMGFGKGRETVPAREKSTRDAKLHLIKVQRGCGSWQCNCGTPHSIPFAIEGKCGSATIKLMPAPRGTGLVLQKECRTILGLAGIKDVYSKTYGDTRSKLNFVRACFDALRRLSEIRVPEAYRKSSGMETRA